MVVPPTPSKHQLRREMRAGRAAYVAGLTPVERSALCAGLTAVLAANLGRGAVAGYNAYGDEIDPGGFDRALLHPLVHPNAALTFHRCTAAELTPGALGILEPAANLPPVRPDIVLVPLLAVDRDGNRIGQGGGYYDRTLALLRSERKVIAVGVAWDMQLVDAVPADPWDAPLDALATPTRWVTFPDRHARESGDPAPVAGEASPLSRA